MRAVEVAVVGAGAAGIAAARRLRELGVAAALVEARDRPGGRAHTVTAAGHPADLGCEWLHDAERNPWTGAATRLGFRIDRTAPEWGERFGIHQLDPAEHAAMHRAFDRFWQAIEEAGTGPDRPVASVLPEAERRWQPAFDALTRYINGAGIDAVSVVDAARYGGGGPNWRVAAGYGTLIASEAGDLDLVTGSPVTAIDLTGPGCVLDTPRGRLQARACVLTVPVGVLRAEAIRITPGLPPDTESALRGIAMGNVTKLFLAVDGMPWDLPPDSTVQGRFDRTRTGSYLLHPLGRPLVEAYFGGALADELERAGPRDMAEFAGDELAGIFGNDVRSRLRPAAASQWAGDPWSRGAYSYALPGGADGRAVLSRPIMDRLFIAGEACSRDAYGTAHGALLSGIAAAEAAAAAIKT